MTEQTQPGSELDFVLDDEPVPPQLLASGTMSIEIVPEQAIAVGEAHRVQAARELAEDGVPPLPDEPQPMSRWGRRYVDPETLSEQYAYEPYLKPRGSRPAPEGFWREYVFGLSFGFVNLGDSRPVRRRKAMDARIARPLSGTHRIPVLRAQGGVGATTVSTLLQLALDDVRDDAPGEVVLDDRAHGADVHDALRDASSVLLVSGGTSEQARLASETVTWLHENELGELADNAVVAINTATPGTRYESLDAIEAHFQARVREVVRIPFDEELVAPGPARYGALRPDTREAARDLAAKVVDGLAAEDTQA